VHHSNLGAEWQRWVIRDPAIDAQREACEAYIKSQAHEGSAKYGSVLI
jgi:hypothetical protein